LYPFSIVLNKEVNILEI